MKSIRVHAFGNSSQLQLDDTPPPDLGMGEVLIAVRAIGVNPVDWKIREGRFSRPGAPTPPYTVGQDFSGEVVKTAATSIQLTPGDRVFGFANGAYAEQVAARAGELARLPEGMSFEAAAALPTPGVTAWQMVTEAANLHANQVVLIHGAAGAAGALAVQIARHRGALVNATAHSQDLGYLRELGVDRVYDSRQERFAAGSEVDAVLDYVGGEVLARSYACVRPGGVIVTALGQVDEAEAARRGIRAVAFRMRRDGAALAALADLYAMGSLRTHVARVLPLPEARQAQDLSQSGAAHGKIILRVA